MKMRDVYVWIAMGGMIVGVILMGACAFGGGPFWLGAIGGTFGMICGGYLDSTGNGPV